MRDTNRPMHPATWPESIDWREGDVRNYSQIRRLVQASAPEIVFHLAAVGANDPFIPEEMALRVNLFGTLNLLRAIRRDSHTAGDITVKRVIVAGTSYEYGETKELDPGNVYAASKVAAWAFCRMYYRAHGIPVVVARPFNIYGPGQNPQALIPAAIRAALRNEDFPTTPGEQRRDFIYVDDVVRGFLHIAVTDGVEGQTFDLGTGLATPVRTVVEQIFALTHSGGCPRFGTLPHRPGIVWTLVADTDKTTRLTSWQATIGLEEGLCKTIKAFAEA
jgi:nucleoside-diphosphate-sugar epimerase